MSNSATDRMYAKIRRLNKLTEMVRNHLSDPDARATDEQQEPEGVLVGYVGGDGRIGTLVYAVTNGVVDFSAPSFDY